MAQNVVFLEKKENGLLFCVRGIGKRENQKTLDKPEGQLISKWFYCTHGSGKLMVHNEEYLIKPGTSFCIKDHTPHRLEGIDCPWGGYFVSFTDDTKTLFWNSLSGRYQYSGYVRIPDDFQTVSLQNF